MEITFTVHALARLKEREISQELVIEVIRFSDNIIKKHGKYYYQKSFHQGTIEVVVEKEEKNLNVITVYWL